MISHKLKLWGLEWCGICVEEISRAGLSEIKRSAASSVRQQTTLKSEKCSSSPSRIRHDCRLDDHYRVHDTSKRFR